MALLIKRTGTPAECSYCSTDCQTITLEELSGHLERAIEEHYSQSPVEPEGLEYYVQRETGHWDRLSEPVEDVISQLLEADDAIAADVRELLDDRTADWDGTISGAEQPFSEEAQYHGKPRATFPRSDEP